MHCLHRSRRDNKQRKRLLDPSAAQRSLGHSQPPRITAAAVTANLSKTKTNNNDDGPRTREFSTQEELVTPLDVIMQPEWEWG